MNPNDSKERVKRVHEMAFDLHVDNAFWALRMAGVRVPDDLPERAKAWAKERKS